MTHPNQPHELDDDADPMIDALLAEFVPSDPAQRKCPPDLSAQILAQLSQTKVHRRTPTTQTTAPTRWSAPTRAFAVAVAIAASLAAIVWLGPAGNTPEDESAPGLNAPGLNSVAENPTKNIPAPQPATGAPTESTDSSVAVTDSPSTPETPSPRRPLRGIPLDSPRIASNDVPATETEHGIGNAPGRGQNPVATPRSTTADPLTLVAAETAATAREYWNQLGITPTPDAPNHEITARLKDQLGIVLAGDVLSDPERLHRALAQPTQAKELAKHWLASATERNLWAMSQPDKADLVDEVARGFSGQQPFDTTLVSLINGSSNQSKQWYQSIGHGGVEGVSKRLADITMNADLRCVECHNSKIGRSGTQEDFWSFVALVRNAVTWQDDGWAVADQTDPAPTFFELPDGRQRLAEPHVSPRLLGAPNDFDGLNGWSDSLVGSRVLAGSLVDSLWQLVHGRKLKPSPVDVFAPPSGQQLDQLHTQLAADLQASGFDVARTLALIIASPMARRSTPDALRGEALLTTSDSDRIEALELVGAFAAAVDKPSSSRKDRMDIAMRRVGGLLQPDEQSALLAQPIFQAPRKNVSTSQSGDGQPAISLAQQLSVDFPSDNSSLPVSWLRSIDDYDQQIQHLVYLSGDDKVPDDLADIAKRLKDNGSVPSALSRIWWILRN
ncbi:hypothetical protein NHH03_14280 [Stieleria sp. TO1_6]|uniref:hypothetical protein n=1 Tax=Stieleria tagensis TaxID=2956795 RepID=UPI00209A8423|nr:hypothetical protein [Stieleria tagensis]MCO8122912.1 hypothetical protein [Stieleria tagensis]